MVLNLRVSASIIAQKVPEFRSEIVKMYNCLLKMGTTNLVPTVHNQDRSKAFVKLFRVRWFVKNDFAFIMISHSVFVQDLFDIVPTEGKK